MKSDDDPQETPSDKPLPLVSLPMPDGSPSGRGHLHALGVTIEWVRFLEQETYFLARLLGVWNPEHSAISEY